MDFITPALLNGVGVVGLFAGLFWMLASGRLLTRREADGIEKRIAFLESALDKTQEALAEEQSANKVVKHFFESLTRGAEL